MKRGTISLWRRAIRGSIWDPALLEEIPLRFRPLYTVALPANYALFGLFGLLGLLTAVPTVAALTSIDYGDVWTMMVGLTGAISLVGLVGRRPQLELYALIALVVGFATYPIALLILALVGKSTLALAAGTWAFVVLPIWRVSDLVRAARRRERAADV